MAVIYIETDRLILRKIAQQDISLYFERITSQEAVAASMMWDPHKHISETEAMINEIETRYTDPCFHRWGIALKSDNSIIGCVELLRFNHTEHTCSFAYMIGEAFWGNGYATEALHAIFSYAFDELDILSITADHFSDNPASGRVMQKLGMHRIGDCPDKYEKNGILHDAEIYQITRTDFQ